MEPAENLELESQLAEVKTVLKEQKQGLARMVGELEERGRKLARREYQPVPAASYNLITKYR